MLRIEDIDGPRTVSGADVHIVRDLTWLGLDWDNELSDSYYQSRRHENYTRALDVLRERGALYECYCSRRELREIASAPHGREPVYPGTCRNLRHTDRRPAPQKKNPALRFRIPDNTTLTFVDRRHGPIEENVNTETGDFIVARADGVISYQLAVVVDDIAMGITDVVRGDDLLSSTARQMVLFQTLGANAPAYAHVPLLLGPDGQRLAKRHGGVSLAELRGSGRRPEDIVGWLAWSCGLIERIEPLEPRDLIDRFDIGLVQDAAPWLPEQW